MKLLPTSIHTNLPLVTAIGNTELKAMLEHDATGYVIKVYLAEDTTGPLDTFNLDEFQSILNDAIEQNGALIINW